MRYFTSDWHINEDRIGLDGKPNLFFRNFTSIRRQNYAIYNSLFDTEMGFNDELIHLGDVAYSIDSAVKSDLGNMKLNYPGKWTLIIGNYDEDKLDFLSNYFENMVHEMEIEIMGRPYYLNHYPAKCVEKEFSITGHIHGLWRVQKNMVNVGVDAWNFRGVDESRIDFVRTACEKYYDENVFPY